MYWRNIGLQEQANDLVRSQLCIPLYSNFILRDFNFAIFAILKKSRNYSHTIYKRELTTQVKNLNYKILDKYDQQHLQLIYRHK